MDRAADSDALEQDALLTHDAPPAHDAPLVLARRAKDLPEEVLRYVMAYSIAVDLAHMERVAHTTRRAAQKAAHQRLTAAPWFRNPQESTPTAASTPTGS